MNNFTTIRNLLNNSQALRFLIVGAVNTVFGYSLFSLFIYCDFYYPLAAFLSTAISIVFNFMTTGNIVFKQAHGRLFWRFVLVCGLVYVINIAILKIGTYFSQNMYLIGALTIPVIAVIAFLLNKYFVFEREGI